MLSLNLLITLSFLISYSGCCQTCEAKLNQLQCLTDQYCIWSEEKCVTVQKCSQLSTIQCATPQYYLMSLQTCIVIDDSCVAVDCSSLIPNEPDDCFNNNCNYTQTNNTCTSLNFPSSSLSSYTCQNATNSPEFFSCSQFTNHTSKIVCYQSETESNCISNTISGDCSTYNVMDACLQMPFCSYISDACVQKTCSILSSDGSDPYCQDYFDNQGNIQHCEVVDGVCTNLPLSSLNQSQCDSPTTQTSWTGTTCQLCSDSIVFNWTKTDDQNSDDNTFNNQNNSSNSTQDNQTISNLSDQNSDDNTSNYQNNSSNSTQDNQTINNLSDQNSSQNSQIVQNLLRNQTFQSSSGQIIYKLIGTYIMLLILQ